MGIELIIASILGSSVLSGFLGHLFGRRKAQADASVSELTADQIVLDMALKMINRLTEENSALRERVAVLEKLVQELRR